LRVAIRLGPRKKSGPQWLCREQLELALGGPPQDQPVFGHITGE
jgi:hypothetical protein